MPWGDGTGPWWAGGYWRCWRGVYGPWFGRGGFWRGFGRGRGWRFAAGYVLPYLGGAPGLTKEEEIEELKAYADELKAELEAIKKRMAELEK